MAIAAQCQSTVGGDGTIVIDGDGGVIAAQGNIAQAADQAGGTAVIQAGRQVQIDIALGSNQLGIIQAAAGGGNA
ncbi:MAG: hypothetical protein RL748_1476, partial [Pseudomonadota bacterium]